MPEIVQKSDIVERAQDNYKRDKEHWGDTYRKALDDLEFLSDDDFAQWDPKDYQARVQAGKPAITVDQLSQFCHQVINEARMNTPSIGIIPADGESSMENAELIKGLIRNIEYVSGADDAYDTAVNYSVKSSIGFIRVDFDYVDETSDDLELLIRGVKNPSAVLIDCESTESDGSDAMHAFVVDKITVEKFKLQYPDKEVCCFDNDTMTFKDGEFITVAEYFEIEEVSAGKTPGGREIKKKVVKRYKLSGKEVLEESVFPGKYIPVVPVYGEEAWIDGKRHLLSLFRKAKGPQQMYNYWKSIETELLQKQSRANFIAAAGQTEDYAEDWTNPDKAVVLRYKATDSLGNPIGMPQKLPPPDSPIAFINASRMAIDDIKATMGIYNASLGMQSNETSGIAIQRRQQEGDVATFHFLDNRDKAITQIGRILVCAIPEVYNTPRALRIIGEEEDQKVVGVNGMMMPDQKEEYDLLRGKYDVKVVTGAPFTTRRQEAADFFTQIVTSQPQLMTVMGDLLFKNMDFAGAEAMSSRMKKLVDPKLLEDDDNVDPMTQQLAMQLEQAQAQFQLAQQEMAALQKQLEDKSAELNIKAQSEAIKADDNQAQNQLEALRIQTDERMKQAELELKAAELALKSRQLDIEEQKIMAELSMKNQQMEMDQANEMIKRADDIAAQAPQVVVTEIGGYP
jgi:hypothetical protein